MLHQVTKKEILTALMCLKPRKTPGPDGLYPIFIQKNWDVVKDFVISFVKNVFEGQKILEGANDTLISLIPLGPNPKSITQFHSISFCNTSYKIITKILVRHMRPFLDKLFSPFQASFVPGRRIVDNMVQLREASSILNKKKGRNRVMIVKLDLEKAYDRLEWSFVRKVLYFFF